MRNALVHSTHWLLLAFAAYIPIQWEFFSPAWLLIAAGIAGIAWTVSTGQWGKYKGTPWGLLILAGWGLWTMASVSWSSHPNEGWSDVVLKLPMWLVPLAVWPVLKAQPISLGHLRSSFAWSTVITWTFVLFYGVWTAGWDGYKGWLVLNRLPVHYQSAYLHIALWVLLIDTTRQWHLWSKTRRAFQLPAMAWLVIGMLLISVRIQWAAFALLGGVVFAVMWYRGQLTTWAKWAVPALGVVLITIGSSNKMVRSRVIDTFNEARSFGQMINNKQTNHRVFLWKYGWEAIGQEWLTGYGNGSEDFVLQEHLKDCDAKFWDGKHTYYLHQERYNYHNEWLQQWAKSGLVGIALFVGIGFWAMRSGSRSTKLMWAVVAFSCATESLLERQAGVFIGTLLILVLIVDISTRNTSTNPG